jgi:excisionase family DNA binding protein
MRRRQKPVIESLVLTIPEVADALQIGQTKVRALIAERSLPTVLIGRSVRVSVASLQRWIEEQERRPTLLQVPKGRTNESVPFQNRQAAQPVGSAACLHAKGP